MKSSWDSSSPVLSVHRDVLFRFGSWCYVGRVQLSPSLSLADIPYLIPALRLQQSRLDYMCEASSIPTNSEFTPVLRYIRDLIPTIESLIASSEESLRSLIDRLSNMGLSESVQNWLEGDSSNSFFEFKCTPDAEVENIFRNIDLVNNFQFFNSQPLYSNQTYDHPHSRLYRKSIMPQESLPS